MSFAVLSLTVLSMLRLVTSVAPDNCADKVAAAWYMPGLLKLSDISWDKYTTLIYSFALTTPTVDSLSLDGSDPSLLPQFVQQAHDKGVAAHIGIGGWTGSRFFSQNVAPENSTAFVKTIVDFIKQYDIDGINFDWEYPNYQGIGCNIINANDTKNFLSFLQELRADPIGSKVTLSAAAGLTTFHDPSGSPSKDVSDFASVLDYITILNYDIWGSWSSVVGPNSPLNDSCVPLPYQDGSAVSGVEAWTEAGMPANKLVLGVAAYGHSFSVPTYDAFVNGSETPELVAYPKFNASNQPLGDSQSGAGGTDVCGNHEGPGGTFTLDGLVEGGFLSTDGNPADDIYYRFDSCSQTAYVYNETSEVMISFDNTEAFASKGKFIEKAGLRGFAMWHAAGDHNDLLLDSIRSAVGIDTTSTSKRNWKGNW